MTLGLKLGIQRDRTFPRGAAGSRKGWTACPFDSAGVDGWELAYLTHGVELAAEELWEWEPKPAPPQTETHAASSRYLHAQITASSSPGSSLASKPVISLPIG